MLTRIHDNFTLKLSIIYRCSPSTFAQLKDKLANQIEKGELVLKDDFFWRSWSSDLAVGKGMTILKEDFSWELEWAWKDSGSNTRFLFIFREEGTNELEAFDVYLGTEKGAKEIGVIKPIPMMRRDLITFDLQIPIGSLSESFIKITKSQQQMAKERDKLEQENLDLKASTEGEKTIALQAVTTLSGQLQRVEELHGTAAENERQLEGKVKELERVSEEKDEKMTRLQHQLKVAVRQKNEAEQALAVKETAFGEERQEKRELEQTKKDLIGSEEKCKSIVASMQESWSKSHADISEWMLEESESKTDLMLRIFKMEQEIKKQTAGKEAVEANLAASKAVEQSLKRELSAKEQAINEAERKLSDLEQRLQIQTKDHAEEQGRADEMIAELHRDREEMKTESCKKTRENDHILGIASCCVGAVLLVIGYFVVAMRWRAEEEHNEEMEGELIAQSQWMKKPHPLVPVVPSAHAGRLGVHENPAVRDVFGMPKHWDVTPGEGFHVSRVTSDGSTPGTTRGTRKSSVVLDVKEEDVEGAEGLPKVPENEVDVVAEQGEQLEI